MDIHIKQLLEQAQRAGRFEDVDSQCLELWVYRNRKNEKLRVEQNSENLRGKVELTKWLKRKGPGRPEAEPPKLAGFDLLGGLRLLIQSSGHEKLPFYDLDTFQEVEKAVNLPQAYVLALDHAVGVVEHCSADSDASCIRNDFIAQNRNYNYDAWSLALSHNTETGITTGFLRADGRTDEHALLEYLREPKRAIDVEGIIRKSEEHGGQLDVETVLECLRSSKPLSNVDTVVQTLRGLGRQLDPDTIIENFREWGFQVASDVSSKDSDESSSEIDVDEIISRQKSFGLHHDLEITSKQLDVLRPKINVKAILKHLIASEEKILHPMLLPTIMYKNLKESSESHLDALHGDISNIERVLRHVKVRGKAVPRDRLVEEQEMHDEELDYQSLSRWLNSCKKDHASREGRHGLRAQFQTQLERAMKGVKNSSPESPASGNPVDAIRAAQILKGGQELEKWISFNTRVFEFEEGLDVNYRVRIEAQLDLLYSLISQRQRRTQQEIAQSTGEDSGAMKYLAYLGSFFVPANLIAAVFAVKEWQMSVGNFFTFFVVTIVFVGLVALTLRCRSLWVYRYELLDAYKVRYFGVAPTSNQSSARKSDSLDRASVKGSRNNSVSSDGRC